MLEEENKVYKAMININIRSNVIKYHNKRKVANKLFFQKKRRMFKKKLETLRSASNNNEVKFFYQEVNHIKMTINLKLSNKGQVSQHDS